MLVDIFLSKLKKARYETIEQSEKNYIVQVAFMDLNSLFLIIAGQAAASDEANKILMEFIEYSLTQKIFKNYFSVLPKLLDDIYCTPEFSEKLTKIPLLLEEYKNIIGSLNKFSTSAEY